MNASVAWLNAFLDGEPFTPAEQRDLLTAHVATVEEVIALRADLAPIVVARVVEEAPHPDSDHLHITKVDVGTGTLVDVVCGAPNVQAGRLYPFAPTGTTMPNGMQIQKRKIRGHTSDGMLCSARELGLGEEHDGIMELDVEAAPGTPFLDVMPVGDARLVIDVLPNRPDLLSHLGLARELAAVTGRSLHLPAVGMNDAVTPPAARFRRAGNAGGVVVHLEDALLARRYMGVIVRGVKVGDSPAWLVERLASVGVRSVNNVVDVTNYVLHELGQPTHAFDVARLDPEPKMPERTVVVRSARDGERLVTLDGVERTLRADMTVIADSVSPIALAGVMGGRSTEVGPDTTDVFLEVASFDPSRTRRTRRAAGVSTDASYRFERGVDPALAPRALERAVALIVAVAGGRVDSAPVDLHAGDAPRHPLILRTARVARVLGEGIPADRIAALLRGIGCGADVEDGGAAVHVVAPTWRSDLVAEVDLIEEVARLHGYDALPSAIRPYRPGATSDPAQWQMAARLREALVGAGLLEVKPVPFVNGGESHVRLANPLAESEAHLRRTLLETLSGRAEHNLAHMEGDVRLFEIGSVFAPGDGALPREEVRVAALIMGRRRPPHFTDAAPPACDAWDAKALALEIVRLVAGDAAVVLEPGSGDVLWRILIGDEQRGTVERLALDAPVWASPAFGVELLLEQVSNDDVAAPGTHAHGVAGDTVRSGARPFRPLPTTPAAEFDVALLLPSSVTAADVERVIRSSAGELLERLVAFDLYEGPGIDPGFRSVAWRLTLRHPERTLRDKEIDGRRSRILTALRQELDVRHRSA